MSNEPACIVLSSDSEDEDTIKLPPPREPIQTLQALPPIQPTRLSTSVINASFPFILANNISTSTQITHIPTLRPLTSVSTSHIGDAHVPAYFNESFVEEDGGKVPVRRLDCFSFTHLDSPRYIPLTELEINPIKVTGFISNPNYHPSQLAFQAIQFEVESWDIEYGLPCIWIKSKHSWYKLQNPDPAFVQFNKPLKLKVDICTCIHNILSNDIDVDYNTLIEILFSRLSIPEYYVIYEYPHISRALQIFPQIAESKFCKVLEAKHKQHQLTKSENSTSNIRIDVISDDLSLPRLNLKSTPTEIKTCHLCQKCVNTDTLFTLKCSNNCASFYCKDCLYRFFGEMDIPSTDSLVKRKKIQLLNKNWVCPFCRNICLCVVCADRGSNNRINTTSSPRINRTK